MKTSRTLTTTTLAVLLAGFGALACGGAETASTEQAEQAQSAGLIGAPSGSAPTPEAMRPAGKNGRRGPDGRRHGPPSPDKMMERFDSDKNGKLEAAELPERMQERIAEIDSSGDGVVSKEELTTHIDKKRLAHAKQRFERKDTNKDGLLDQSELGERWAKLGVADQNGDKKLTADELRAAFEAGKLEPMRGEHGKRWKGEAPAAPEANPAPAAPAL